MARFGWAALCVTVSAIIAFLVVVQASKKRDALALSTVKVLVGEGHGSGVHTGNRYIVTAAHVVGQAATVKVKTSRGGEVNADVLWVNKAHDIALLRAQSLPDVDVSRLACGNPSVGQSVSAVGNPGPLEFITAYGRVSSLLKHGNPWADFYIVSMAIAPGMSGGPVFNEQGQVIGLVVGVAMMSIGWAGAPIGFGYVTPSSSICRMLARNA
jgi:S1-C subfamily serine protease